MKKFLSLLLSASMVASMAACSTNTSSSQTASTSSVGSSAISSTSTGTSAKPTKDRSGLSITVPDEINSIVVLAPSLVEIVVALGAGDKIVAIDSQSVGLEDSLSADLPVFDAVTPNAEQIAALQPDLVLATNLSGGGGENPFTPLTNLGICVAITPTSDSIVGIQEDITFIADVLGETEKGEELIATMQKEIDDIAAIGATIPVEDKKKVYFEIAFDPSYSFGSGVFLNEMITLIGAENVLANEQGWLLVEPEAAIASNPDVILTNVNYIDAPVDEILARTGWQNVSAVQNKQVFYIDNMASSLPNQNIVVALKEMAQAVYPEYYTA